MFGEQIGRLYQPLENLVVEEIEKNDIKVLNVTVSMRRVSDAILLSERINNLTKEKMEIGELYTDSEGSIPLSFTLPFSQYFDLVSKLNCEQDSNNERVFSMTSYPFIRADIIGIVNGHPSVRQYPFYCAASNITQKNPNRQVDVFYLLAPDGTVEGLFSLNQYKLTAHPQANRFANQGVIGYRFSSSNNAELGEIIKNIISTCQESSYKKGVLTKNQIAFMGESITEFAFQLERIKNQNTGKIYGVYL